MILYQIVVAKETELRQRQDKKPLTVLEQQLSNVPDTRDFVGSLKTHAPAVIAEIKKASPSRGILREDFKPVEIARSYERNDAAALSVLTDEPFFQGSDQYLVEVRNATNLPILRKDFILDSYRIVESRCIGADCVLLIVSILNTARLQQLYSLGLDLSLDVLVEVHNAYELSATLNLEPVPALIGINNRNLRTFETNLSTTESLIESIPESTVTVSESGINDRADIDRLRNANVDAFLVGEAFMRADNPGQQLSSLFGQIQKTKVE